ncbi:MAG: PadR family transcriptional regulator [Candidatus Protistobacter heckmanni]|nr:PadR family transcriptional regulator [Candidatus Protistobacter heckmanni]
MRSHFFSHLHQHFHGHHRDGRRHDVFAFFHHLHSLKHAMRRGHHGGRHGGPFGGGPFGFGDGDDGMHRGRKFSSDDLQLFLLALLADEPRHGYDLIKTLEQRSNGFYTPSPGMVYPALTYLEEAGYVSVEQEGNRKRYALSDEGRAHLEANRQRIDLMFAKLDMFARKMDMVRQAFAGQGAEDDGQGEGGNWQRDIMEARHALKHAMILKANAPAAEQQRIAAILRRAAEEIGGKTTKE